METGRSRKCLQIIYEAAAAAQQFRIVHRKSQQIDTGPDGLGAEGTGLPPSLWPPRIFRRDEGEKGINSTVKPRVGSRV